MGKTCVCGAEELEVDVEDRGSPSPATSTVNEGDVISIDGTSGAVYLGEVPVGASPVVAVLRRRAEAPRTGRARQAVHRIMTHADTAARLGVRANADNPEDAARARRFGAAGIGLCRTEHMFLGERRQLIEDLILAESAAGAERGARRPQADAARGLHGISRRWTGSRSRYG